MNQQSNESIANTSFQAPPTFGTPWSLGEHSYQAIRSDLGGLTATKNIVEFGGGVSTLRLNQDFPGSSILSIESESEFLNQTRRYVEQHGDPTRVQLSLRNIRWQRHGFCWYQSYAVGWFPQPVDVVLIDGPPIATRRGREACLHQVFPLLRSGARIYLDDYSRLAEQQVVRNWLSVFGNALRLREVLRTDHEIAVLERTEKPLVKRHSPSAIADSWIQMAKTAYRTIQFR